MIPEALKWFWEHRAASWFSRNTDAEALEVLGLL